eukprot:CAMPEP_0119502758 /NCGR_PEP_ID=MMETSP1344-20130328/24128_1 /TAXON_ID=236787 /ORGANISM="Florenciella parvula, Strain CCMP2471" /LENGTH=312 /DNA_ID=CAMNT_0007538991 /DNA_START=24 /DNA_END=959 /DNA_ORIENTATION=+
MPSSTKTAAKTKTKAKAEGKVEAEAKGDISPDPMVIMVKSVTGEEIALPELWKHRKVVMVFLRHLGCRFCLQQTAHLVEHGIASKLKSVDPDMALIVISMGTVSQAAQWVQITKFDGEVYVDDTTDGNMATGAVQDGSKAYQIMKLKRGPNMVMNDTTASIGGITALAYPDLDGEKWVERDRDGNVTVYPGDVFQVGGAFVFGPGNQCDYAFRSEYAGHYPDLADVMHAATGRKSDGSEYVYDSTKTWFNRLNANSLAEPSTRPRSASSMPEVVTKAFAKSGTPGKDKDDLHTQDQGQDQGQGQGQDQGQAT